METDTPPRKESTGTQMARRILEGQMLLGPILLVRLVNDDPFCEHRNCVNKDSTARSRIIIVR